MSFISTLGRIGAGAATLGASELVRPALSGSKAKGQSPLDTYKPPPGSTNPDDIALAAFNKKREDAARAMAGANLVRSQADNATTLGNQVTQQAAQTTPYGYSSDTSGLQAAAMNNPAALNLALKANAEQPYQADLNAAGSAARGAVGTAGQLATPGSYAGAQQSALSQQGDQIGQFGNDVGLLRATAEGKGPSAAEHLAASALGANSRAMQSVAAGARGGNLAAGIRAATNAGTQQALQSTQQIAALRAQEQLAGQAQLASAQGQLAGANAARSTAVTNAQAVENQRQGAAATAATQAAQGLNQVAQTGVAGAGQTYDAIAAGGQLYGQGVQTATGAYSAGGQVAAEEAKNLEEQKRRALEAANVLGTQAGNNMNRESAATTASKGGNITQSQVVGGLFSAGGQALGMAAGK
jgi:hypothetical protein